MADEQVTIRDTRGASLVLERDDNGQPSAWIAPPGGNDGPSVTLDATAVAQIAAFLGLRRVEPAVDCDGDEVWLNAQDEVDYADEQMPAEEGWRRLYVEPRPVGEPTP